MNTYKYNYKNCPVPGGGFVTGYVFHPKCKNILYARTDIGGTYRLDFENNIWVCLIDHVTAENTSECNPLSICIDVNDCNALYIACGDAKTGTLCISHDRGDSFIYKKIPCGIHGNFPGRGTGERLIKSKGDLYFASQTDGLFRSSDEGDTWERLDVCAVDGVPEKNLTFIWVDPRNSNTIVVGTNGECNKVSTNTRGQSLYMSIDKGLNFKIMPQSENIIDPRCDINGFVAQRSAFDGEYLYVTFASISYSTMKSFACYTCDTGGCFDGRLYKYGIDIDGTITSYEDITPDIQFSDADCLDRKLDCGLGGVDYQDGMLICSTISRGVDIVFLSFDEGESFTKVLQGTEIGNLTFDVPYMEFEKNGGGSIVHWMCDIKINPFDSDMAVFTTGTGIFKSLDLTVAKRGEEVSWTSYTKGIEETVHLNVYAIPDGEVKVLDIIGDLGGFAFTDLDTPCDDSFNDGKGNRYITCLNGDFSDNNPFTILATPRGNWTGRTKGGVIITHDQCKTWKLLPYPYGITKEIDSYIEKIKQPNVDSGWVAVTADNEIILWCVASSGRFLSSSVVYTKNEGQTWEKSNFLDKNSQNFDETPINIRVFSDRVNPNVLYAFGHNSRIFVSLDKGRTFNELDMPEVFPDGMFVERRSFEIRVESGLEGSIWISLGTYGLYRIVFSRDKSTFNVVKILSDSDSAYCIGLGKKHDSSDCNTLYINGNIGGEYGFYRSIDYGKTWDRINDKNQMFGYIISIDGDKREFGTFYLATGSKGLIYGKPSE